MSASQLRRSALGAEAVSLASVVPAHRDVTRVGTTAMMSEDWDRRDALVTHVAIQERRRLLRDGLRTVLGDEGQIVVTGVAASADDMRSLARSVPIDVAVVEVRPGEWDVPRLVGDLRRAVPGVRVIGLHSGRRSDHLAIAEEIDVAAMVSYAAGAAGLIAAIRGVELAPAAKPPVERRMVPQRGVLTCREVEVLRHISWGLTTEQNAQLLGVSPKTVDNHKQRIFAKLGVQNQAHAVAVAHRAGILRPAQREAIGA